MQRLAHQNKSTVSLHQCEAVFGMTRIRLWQVTENGRALLQVPRYLARTCSSVEFTKGNFFRKLILILRYPRSGWFLCTGTRQQLGVTFDRGMSASLRFAYMASFSCPRRDTCMECFRFVRVNPSRIVEVRFWLLHCSM